MPWEKGAPSPGLVDFLAAHPELERGTVGVPGCGTGHDVRAWARAGFAAFGYDIAPSAIRLASQRTRSARLSAQFQVADFLRDTPPRPFDWVFEHTLFCAIQPAERDDYVRALLRWLKPGGQYLAVNYLIPDQDGPPFGTTRDELCRRFSLHFQLLEEWVPRSYPNRTGLELMLWWRRTGETRRPRAEDRNQKPEVRDLAGRADSLSSGSVWRLGIGSNMRMNLAVVSRFFLAVAVRYGWANTPEVNLFDKEGLPATPFRTDAK